MRKGVILLCILSLSFLSGCKWLKDWREKKEEVKKEEIAAEKYVAEITDEDDFKKNVLESKIPVVVKFEAEFCGVCKTMVPIYVELAKTYKEKMNFVTLDIVKLGDLAKKYNVSGVPVFLFFKDGEIVGRIEGGGDEIEEDKKRLENKIEEVLKQ